MKVQDLKPGDIIEWCTSRQLEVEHVIPQTTGDVEIMGKGVDFNGYGVGTYTYDTDLLLIAHG